MQSRIQMGHPQQSSYEVRSHPENAFTDVLSESGARALFYYLEKEHGVSAADIVKRPADFNQALSSILGDYGSSLLMHRVSPDA
jgi:hypothetical protein